nr:tetratricopeptide repeat protein [Akkermansia muciniphila]
MASNNFLKDEDQPYRRADGMLDKASILLGLGKYADARKTAEDALALGVEGPLMASLKIVLGDIPMRRRSLMKRPSITVLRPSCLSMTPN